MNERDLMQLYAAAIKRERKKRGMTMKEFADFVGVGVNSIFNHENGRHMPNLYTAMLIADKLGVSVDGLIYGEKGDDD